MVTVGDFDNDSEVEIHGPANSSTKMGQIRRPSRQAVKNLCVPWRGNKQEGNYSHSLGEYGWKCPRILRCPEEKLESFVQLSL